MTSISNSNESSEEVKLLRKKLAKCEKMISAASGDKERSKLEKKRLEYQNKIEASLMNDDDNESATTPTSPSSPKKFPVQRQRSPRSLEEEINLSKFSSLEKETTSPQAPSLSPPPTAKVSTNKPRRSGSYTNIHSMKKNKAGTGDTTPGGEKPRRNKSFVLKTNNNDDETVPSLFASFAKKKPSAVDKPKMQKKTKKTTKASTTTSSTTNATSSSKTNSTSDSPSSPTRVGKAVSTTASAVNLPSRRSSCGDIPTLPKKDTSASSEEAAPASPSYYKKVSKSKPRRAYGSVTDIASKTDKVMKTPPRKFKSFRMPETSGGGGVPSLFSSPSSSPSKQSKITTVSATSPTKSKYTPSPIRKSSSARTAKEEESMKEQQEQQPNQQRFVFLAGGSPLGEFIDRTASAGGRNQPVQPHDLDQQSIASGRSMNSRSVSERSNAERSKSEERLLSKNKNRKATTIQRVPKTRNHLAAVQKPAITKSRNHLGQFMTQTKKIDVINAGIAPAPVKTKKKMKSTPVPKEEPEVVVVTAVKKQPRRSSMKSSSSSSSPKTKKSLTFKDSDKLCEEYEIPRLEDSLIDELFWTEEEIGDFRYEAFMEECGLDSSNFD